MSQDLELNNTIELIDNIIENSRYPLNAEASTPAPTAVPEEQPGLANSSLHWENDTNRLGHSSYAFLLEWMCEGENIMRFPGDTASGQTKEVICGKIKQDLIDNGNLFPRTPKSIQGKIDRILKEYRLARKWIQQTGQGILDKIDKRDDEALAKAYSDIESKFLYNIHI